MSSSDRTVCVVADDLEGSGVGCLLQNQSLGSEVVLTYLEFGRITAEFSHRTAAQMKCESDLEDSL